MPGLWVNPASDFVTVRRPWGDRKEFVREKGFVNQFAFARRLPLQHGLRAFPHASGHPAGLSTITDRKRF
jgi:hypothetical protein